MNPWLSVIVPVYNGERYLAGALDSVAAQAGEVIEIVAVDDGSSDRSLAILESYEGRLPLQICRSGRTGNWVAATNRGLARARGDYICMLHQDDVWLPGRVARVKQLIDAGRRPALILSDACFIDEHGGPLGRWTCPLPPDAELLPEEVLPKLLVQNFVPLPAATFAREAALGVGGLDESLWYTADWDLWLKIAAAGTTHYTRRCFASFRVHDESQTATRSRSSGDFRAQLETVLNRHLAPWREKRGGGEVDEVARAALFSVNANVAAAALAHGSPAQTLALAGPFLTLGPRGWRRYLQDSRIKERLGARIRARLRANGAAHRRRAPQEVRLS
jgi:GT2 family glycosyltransferase